MKKSLSAIVIIVLSLIGVKAFARILENKNFKGIEQVEGSKKGSGNGGGGWTSYKPSTATKE